MINSSNLFYEFSKDLEPVASVKTGQTITIETVDAFGGQLQSETDELKSLDWSKVNPATGPIYIEGAQKGDLLKVKIEGIELSNRGVMASIPDAGVFGDCYEKSSIKFFEIYDDYTDFNDLVIPIQPMIGVIGVAPENNPVPNGEPGPHGGNMDNRLINVGTTLYLPVFTDGALFGIGDLHAKMGDGEVNVTGIEISGKVTLTFELVKGLSHGHPLMIKDGLFYTIYSHSDLDSSIQGACNEMLFWTKKALNYDNSDAAMLMSLMGHTEICQIVDPKKTTRFKMPNIYFRTLKL